MLHVTIIESANGFRPIVEDRATRRAYAEPVWMDSYKDALKVAKDAAQANAMGDWRTVTIERKQRAVFKLV